jgi:hypothetical protein
MHIGCGKNCSEKIKIKRLEVAGVDRRRRSLNSFALDVVLGRSYAKSCALSRMYFLFAA